MWQMFLRPLLFLIGLSLASSYSFTEEFNEDWEKRWIPAKDEKYKGQFKVEALEPDNGLYIPKKAMFYGLTTLLDEAFDPSEGVILQFETKWSKDQTCSGAYLKFYSHDPNFKAEDMKEDTKYTIMFGPDKCGSTNKVHLILNHKSPKSGKIEEKHSKNPGKVPLDKKSHVYTAMLKPDNTFQVMLDDVVVSDGSIFENFEPPFNPPKEISDPEDKKPNNWVDEAKIDDPNASKPDDWVEERMIDDMDAKKPSGWLDDEPAEVTDPGAVIPEDWDEEEDGVWTPPTIPNPKCKKAPGCGEWQQPKKPNPDYKGPWKAPKIDNPDYKGPWEPRKIPNPEHYVDDTPLKNLAPIGSIGLELWTMDDGIFFDNVIVTKDAELAKKYRNQWEARHKLEEEKEKKEIDEKKKTMSEKVGAAGFLQRLINNPSLESVRPYLQPAVTFAEDNAPGFYVFLAVVGGLLLSTLIRCFRRRPKKDDVGKRKKEDVSEPDDPVTAPVQSSSKETNGTEDKGTEEQEAEEEAKEAENEDETPVKSGKRGSRTSRAE